jgi:hypothetical protein
MTSGSFRSSAGTPAARHHAALRERQLRLAGDGFPNPAADAPLAVQPSGAARPPATGFYPAGGSIGAAPAQCADVFRAGRCSRALSRRRPMNGETRMSMRVERHRYRDSNPVSGLRMRRKSFASLFSGLVRSAEISSGRRSSGTSWGQGRARELGPLCVEYGFQLHPRGTTCHVAWIGEVSASLRH